MPNLEIRDQISKTTFTTYDIFGYLIPGSTFISICLIFDVWLRNHADKPENSNTAFLTAFSTILDDRIFNSLTLSIVYIILAIILAYVTGHIIASISAFSIDRLLTGKGYYYPFITLTTDKSKLDTKGSKNRVRGGFTLFNSLIVVFTILLMINGRLQPSDHTEYISITLIVILILLLVWTFFYTTGRDLSGDEKEVNRFILFFAELYSYWAERIGHFTGTHALLPHDTIKKFKKFVTKELKVKEMESSDVYWYSYMYVVQNSPNDYKNLSNWLHQYSFARNLSTALYLSSIYALINITLNKIGGLILDPISYIILPLLYLASFIMLTRYHYLYVSYYSKYLIRSCVFLYDMKK